MRAVAVGVALLACVVLLCAAAPARAAAPPQILGVRHSPSGLVPPATAVRVEADVATDSGADANAAPAVRLRYQVGYAPPQELEMVAAALAGTTRTFVANIPATAFQPGDLLRWRVRATAGATTTPLPPNERWLGGAAAAAPCVNGSALPQIYWYAPDIAAAATEAGGNDSSVALGPGGVPGGGGGDGFLHPEVISSRRGVTTLAYPKPKLEFEIIGNSSKFRYAVPDAPLGYVITSDSIKLNGLYAELGDNSYMREAVASQVLREAGVAAPASFHVELLTNGRFAGLYGVVEPVDAAFMERHGLPRNAPLFKSLSGELSNLRWDLPAAELPAYWGRPSRQQRGDWERLDALARGLAGGGAVPRSRFVFDALNVPALVNELAAQALLVNQDRCTKNFYLVYDNTTAEWSRIPWDIEASMGLDHGLGGAPGNLYCILDCEQWSSPLYCDSEHPQDIEVRNSWGSSVVTGNNPYQGPSVRGASAGRRRLHAPPPSPSKPLVFPQPRGWDDPDRVQIGARSPNGAPGTYNHLTDALLDAPQARAMYLRRLRTLADRFYAGGRLRQIVEQTHARIAPAAAADTARWRRGDPERGYRQLLDEFIPTRSKQLLETYAPGGARPLLPAAQDGGSARLDVARIALGEGAQSYVQIKNPSGDVAVDASGWRLRCSGAAGEMRLPPGAVVAGGASAYVVRSAPGFRARAASPKGGEGLLVIQAPPGALPASGGGGCELLGAAAAA